MGAKAIRLESQEDIPRAISEFLQTDGPVLLNGNLPVVFVFALTHAILQRSLKKMSTFILWYLQEKVYMKWYL